MGQAPQRKRVGKARMRYDDFLDVLKKFRSLSVTTLAAGATVPFIAYFADIAPPWPPGATLITGLVELITLILVFQFFHLAPRRTINKVLTFSAPALLVAGALYLLVFSFATYDVPGSEYRGIRGFICKVDIPKKTSEECPLVGRERLKDAEYRADLIWKEWTIHVATVILALIWLTCFLLLSTVIGTFLVYQTKARSRALGVE
jgi:hypothetical protein